MQVEFKNLLKENYYKSLTTISLAAGFSLCSFFGIYMKDIVFGNNTSQINFDLCIIYLLLGIIALAAACLCGLRIDQTKGVKKQ